MLSAFIIILLLACAVAYRSPAQALYAILVIGFLQDPFRKVVAGEPIYLIVTVGVVFAFVLLQVIQSRSLRELVEPLTGWSSSTRAPILLFFVVLVAQLLHSLIRYKSVVLSGIGFVSYLAPFLAIMVGYALVSRTQDIRRFLKFYVLVGFLLAITVLASFSGVDWAIFKEIGVGLKIYDQGTVLRSFSGFMRTGEIAAWHIATSCCFLIMLFFSSDKNKSNLLVAVLIVLMLIAISLTGRRKMLMLVSMFSVLFIFGQAFYRRTFTINYVIMLTTVLIVAWLVMEVLIPDGLMYGVQNYLARGSSVYGDVYERAMEMGVRPISWAIHRVGVFGGGLGIASQGSHLFNVTAIAGGSGEGGLGKVVVELGIPGLLVSLWLVVAYARYISSAIKLSAQPFVPERVLPLMLGIAALLAVNVLTFSVATQVYGDIFILIVIGLMAGFLFALPKLVIRAVYDQPENIGKLQAAIDMTAERSSI